jgi:hypothetical protein
MSLREKQKTKTRPEKRVVRIEEKARGRREGKGGGGEEEKSQLGGVLSENEKFRSRGETEIILQNELDRSFLLKKLREYQSFSLTIFHGIFYPSNSPGNCVFGLVLTVQPQPGSLLEYGN